jgi:hypothetical protein
VFSLLVDAEILKNEMHPASTETVSVLSREKVRPANVLGADADLTEFATNRKKTTAAKSKCLDVRKVRRTPRR